MEIKGYRIEEEISRGPITTVYLARELELDRLVILKVLNAQWMQDSELVERFRREARICARLRHPHIVTLYGFGTADNCFYLSMEYVPGISLKELIQKNHPLPFPVVIYIAQTLVKGLAYAHEQGVIHRDLKPGNVIVSQEGLVKITDFGLATLGELSRITAEGSAIGTPAYMAPEQARGSGGDQRSDLFSLGVTLYELSIGRSPFLGDNVASTIQNVLRKHPKPIHRLRTDIPRWFSEVVQQLIEKDPARRPASAREVYNRLRKHGMEEDEEIFQQYLHNPGQFTFSTRATPQRERLSGWFRIFLVSFGALVILLGGWYFRHTLTNSGTSPTVAPPQQKQLDTTFSATLDTAVPPAQQPPPLERNPELSPVLARRETASEEETTERKSNAKPSTVAEALGGIFIICSPWAQVWIDGKLAETTPLWQPIPISPGVHSLELRNPNFLPIRKKVEVEPGQVDTFRFELKPAFGKLQLQVSPWAKVFVDGHYVDTTPLSSPLSLRAGKHVLRLENPGYQTWEDTVRIRAGDILQKKIRLVKK